MKCPFCAFVDTKVVDSRPDKDSAAIRRRRECESCSRRFTTFERVEEVVLPMILKKDGRREPYNRNKVVGGMKKACEKRPVSVDAIEEMANRLESRLLESGEKEISGHVIGEWIMHELHDLDEVAYVRFASVYRSFRDITEFMSELQNLLKGDQHGGHKRKGGESKKVKL